MSPPGEDDLSRLQRELDEADATIAELTRENAALANGAPQRAGGVVPQGADERSVRSRDLLQPATSPVYRSADRHVHAEETLAKAHATVATLRIDNSILRTQSQSRRMSRLPTLAVLAGLFALGALGWFAPELAIIVAVVAGIGYALMYLIGAIPPRDGPPPPAPGYPSV